MKPEAHCFCQKAHRFIFKACSVAIPQRALEFKADVFLTK